MSYIVAMLLLYTEPREAFFLLANLLDKSLLKSMFRMQVRRVKVDRDRAETLSTETPGRRRAAALRAPTHCGSSLNSRTRHRPCFCRRSTRRCSSSGRW